MTFFKQDLFQGADYTPLLQYVEKELYLNLYNSDTDGDGLTEGQEINTYSTDPNDSDTDSDGSSDGQEVNTYSTDQNFFIW